MLLICQRFVVLSFLATTSIRYHFVSSLSRTFFIFFKVFDFDGDVEFEVLLSSQWQLAYNSTAAGRSQHISGGFVEVGHLAVFTAIVWIVPIICAILIFVACGENLEYGKRHQLFVFPANNRSARKITVDAFTLWFRKFSLHNATSFNCVPHAHITIGYNILLRCACKTQSFTEPLAPEGASDFFIYIVIVIHKNISH